MEFTEEEFENAIIMFTSTEGRFSVDGFRKGKAPRSIIEKKYGEGVFFEDAINNLFSANYPSALDELELNVIDSLGGIQPDKEGRRLYGDHNRGMLS